MAKRHLNVIGDLESLFARLEELVLANSGEDEFEEVFKLLIAKLFDEVSGGSQFRLHKDDQATFDSVVQLLHKAANTWPGILEERVPRLVPEHLSICVDALSKHTLSSESLEIMDGLFEFMVAKSAKGAKGQYFTPRHVVELCVRILKPQANELVLDPACGSGGFLVHALNFVRPTLKPADLRKYAATKLWGFDVDARAVRVAKALMILAGDGHANVVRLNSLLRPTMSLFSNEEAALTIEDVCRSRLRNHKGFDIILTNPPFAGEVRERQFLDGYSVSTGRTRIERDILFIERCVQLLRPGGRMAMVLPHNKFASDAFGYLRSWIFKHARVLGVVGLGRNTFLPHTHQKASVLFLRKHDDVRKHNQDYKVFFAISERDGKNSKGQLVLRSPETRNSPWTRVDHDLADIQNDFDSFLTSESAGA